MIVPDSHVIFLKVYLSIYVPSVISLCIGVIFFAGEDGRWENQDNEVEL
jgi:hypothetical protein